MLDLIKILKIILKSQMIKTFLC